VTLPGDATLDGEVGREDFLALSDGFGSTGAGWEHGDFNADGHVDASDYMAFKKNLGRSIPPPPPAVAAQETAGDLSSQDQAALPAEAIVAFPARSATTLPVLAALLSAALAAWEEREPAAPALTVDAAPTAYRAADGNALAELLPPAPMGAPSLLETVSMEQCGGSQEQTVPADAACDRPALLAEAANLSPLDDDLLDQLAPPDLLAVP